MIYILTATRQLVIIVCDQQEVTSWSWIGGRFFSSTSYIVYIIYVLCIILLYVMIITLILIKII